MSRGARFQAAQNGETRYVSGKPCKRGHTGERITATGTCVECKKIKERERYLADTKKAILKVTNYYKRNAEKIKEKRRVKYAENPEKELAVAKKRSAEWRAANPDKVALHEIRARARSTKVKDLPPPAHKSPLDYIKKGK